MIPIIIHAGTIFLMKNSSIIVGLTIPSMLQRNTTPKRKKDWRNNPTLSKQRFLIKKQRAMSWSTSKPRRSERVFSNLTQEARRRLCLTRRSTTLRLSRIISHRRIRRFICSRRRIISRGSVRRWRRIRGIILVCRRIQLGVIILSSSCGRRDIIKRKLVNKKYSSTQKHAKKP
jgi:hypothetical protein